MAKADDRTGAIFKQIPAIMAEVASIEKRVENPQYKGLGIDDLYAALQPLLAKYQVFIVPAVISQVREERKTRSGGLLIYTILTINHGFYAADGSSVHAITVGEAMDSGDKASNKAMSAAMKYALREVFAIRTFEGDDTEGHDPQPVPTTDAPDEKF